MENGEDIRFDQGNFNYFYQDFINNHKFRRSSSRSNNKKAVVFRGIYRINGEDHPVAVKRYETEPIRDYVPLQRAIDNLKFLKLPGNHHPNFIHFFCHYTNDQFDYLLTELCICSVADLVDERRIKDFQDYTEPDPIKRIKVTSDEILNHLPHKEILRQSTEAVNFLHGLGLIHRNLHPDNFLIKKKSENEFIVKLTDFQLTKDWEKFKDLSNSYTWSDWNTIPECGAPPTGSASAIAEVAAQEKKADQDPKSDVFILACYFYYVLSGGNHPFGDTKDDRKENIKKIGYIDPYWNCVRKLSALSDDHERRKASELIQSMIQFKPSLRKSLWEVLEHEFFYPNQPNYKIYEDSVAETDDQPIQTTKKPGLCVIISQENFILSDNLPGMKNDAYQLTRTFGRFGYDVLLYEDLRSDQMIQRLNPADLARQLRKDNLEDYSSLVVCILSHGDNGAVYGVEASANFGVNGKVSLNKLRDLFHAGNCPEMTGKPKIFVIFACQGAKDQMVRPTFFPEYPSDVEMVDLQYSAANHVPENQGVMIDENHLKDTPPIADFLFLLSSIEDFKSYYIKGVGSPFIAHLCGALISEYGDNDAKTSKEEQGKRDLVHLFTSAVAPRVSRWIIPIDNQGKITYRQTPELRSSLTKTIRFRAKATTFDIANAIKAAVDAERNDPSLPIMFTN